MDEREPNGQIFASQYRTRHGTVQNNEITICKVKQESVI